MPNIASTYSTNALNNQGWQIQLREDSEQSVCALKDKWGIEPTDPCIFVFNNLSDDFYNLTPFQLLQREVTKLSHQDKTFGFQVEKKDGCLFIVFDKYGLAGGGRKGGIAFGGAEAVGGLAAVAFGVITLNPVAIIGGGVLVNMGMQGVVYSIKAKEEDLATGKFTGEFCKVTGKACLSGLATSIIFQGGAKFFDIKPEDKVKAGLLRAAFSMGSTAAREASSKESTVKKGAKKVVVNGLSSFLISTIFSPLSKIPESASLCLEALKKGTTGAAESAADAVASLAIDNKFEGKNLTKGLPEAAGVAALTGFSQGAVSGGAEFYRTSSVPVDIGAKNKTAEQKADSSEEQFMAMFSEGLESARARDDFESKKNVQNPDNDTPNKPAFKPSDGQNSHKQNIRKLQSEVQKLDLQNEQKSQKMESLIAEQQKGAQELRGLTKWVQSLIDADFILSNDDLNGNANAIVKQLDTYSGTRLTFRKGYSPNKGHKHTSNFRAKVTLTGEGKNLSAQHEFLRQQIDKTQNEIAATTHKRQNVLGKLNEESMKNSVIWNPDKNKASQKTFQQIQEPDLVVDPSDELPPMHGEKMADDYPGVRKERPLDARENQVDPPMGPSIDPSLRPNFVYPPLNIVDMLKGVNRLNPSGGLLEIEGPQLVADHDSSWEELKKHLVLVHGVCVDSENLIDGIDWDRIDDDKYKFMYFLKKVLSEKGKIAQHLEYHKNQFQEKPLNRPTLHWAWNQLVQPHSVVNNWEEASIAFLEPAEEFDNPDSKDGMFGIAPYDSFTIGPHKLSKKATIIIPKCIETEAKEYLEKMLKDRPVTIVSYDESDKSKSFRKIVYETLKETYPKLWTLVDETGREIGNEVHKTRFGYPSETYIKTLEGEIIPLFSESGDYLSQLKAKAIKDAVEKKELFFGIAPKSPVFDLEDDKNPYFSTLKKFVGDGTFKDNTQFFAGFIKEEKSQIASLGIIEVLKFAKKNERRPQTIELVNVTLNEAFLADLKSIFSSDEEYKEKIFDFSLDEKWIAISYVKESLLNQLNNLQKALEEKKPNEENIKKYFQNYKAILKASIESILKSRELNDKPIKSLNEKDVTKVKDLLDDIEKDSDFIRTCQKIKDKPIEKSQVYRLIKYSDTIKNFLPLDDNLLKQIKLFIEEQTKKSDLDAPTKTYLESIKLIVDQRLKEIYYTIQFNDEIKTLDKKSKKVPAFYSLLGLKPFDATIFLGSCLFDNVAHQIYTEQSQLELLRNSSKLRELTVSYLKNHQEEMMPYFDGSGSIEFGDGGIKKSYNNFDEYLKLISKPPAWAGELEMIALAKVLDSPIVRLNPKERPLIYNKESKNTPLFIGFKNGNHYISALASDDKNANDIYAQIVENSLDLKDPSLDEKNSKEEGK